MNSYKKSFGLFFICVNIFCSLQGQQARQENLITSQSLTGFWRMVMNLQATDGSIKKVQTVNYKIYNTDGTFFTFITWLSEGVHRKGSPELQYNVTDIGLYGTYKITSDSALTETIIRHALTPDRPPYESKLMYRLVSPNELQILWDNNGTWVPELWERVMPAVLPDTKGKTNLSGQY